MSANDPKRTPAGHSNTERLWVRGTSNLNNRAMARCSPTMMKRNSRPSWGFLISILLFLSVDGASTRRMREQRRFSFCFYIRTDTPARYANFIVPVFDLRQSNRLRLIRMGASYGLLMPPYFRWTVARTHGVSTEPRDHLTVCGSLPLSKLSPSYLRGMSGAKVSN
jgi:hypothetical protein